MFARARTPWPRIYPRTYSSGRTVWIVDLGKVDGKQRKRCRFDSKAAAKAFAKKCRKAKKKYGAAMTALPFEVLGQAQRLYDLLQAHGISFEDARRHYETEVIPFLSAPTVAEIAQQMIEQQIAKGNRPSSVDTVTKFVKRFAVAFGDRQLGDLTEEELRDFCFKDGSAAKTRRNLRAMTSQRYRLSVQKKWVSENIALHLVVPRLPDKEPAYLVVDKVRRFLAVAEQFDVLGYLVLSLFNGDRPEELHRLDWSDVHLDDLLVCIVAAASKIHERREVPIHGTLLAWLVRCHKGSGPIVDGKDFAKRLRAARRAAGIEDWPNDVLRHTFATYHAAAFKDLNETARQMGHIDGLRTLRKHYVAYVPEVVAKEFWNLTPDAVLGAAGSPKP
jgi:integrase